MAKKFSELRARMSPAARAESAEIAAPFRKELRLHQARQAVTSRSAASHEVRESASKHLRDIEADHGLHADTFKLVGSGRITEGIEAPLQEIRLEATAAAENKLASL